jgi:hypothetical protein
MNKIVIQSDGTPHGTKVFAGNTELTRITSIKWEMKDAQSTGIATLTFFDVEIQAVGELEE